MDHDATLIPTDEPIPAPQPSPQTSTLRKVFIGDDGLGAGWSLLIFLAIFAVIIFGVNFVGHKFFPNAPKPPKAGEEGSPSFLFIAEAIPFVFLAFFTWVMSKIERRPASAYGFGGRRRLMYFFSGLAWGIVCLSILIAVLWKSGLLAFDGRLLFGRDILRYGAIWLLGFLLVGLFEEYLTRGYLQFTLTRGLAGVYQWLFKTEYSKALGFWTSGIIFSILFGLGHGTNPGESPIGLLSAGSAAMLFCFSLWRTGSLWWAIGFHTSWDWGQSFLYGVADSGIMAQHHLFATHPIGKPILSGGTTGPEGSIFILAILALAGLIVTFTLPRTQYGEAPAPLSRPPR